MKPLTNIRMQSTLTLTFNSPEHRENWMVRHGFIPEPNKKIEPALDPEDAHARSCRRLYEQQALCGNITFHVGPELGNGDGDLEERPAEKMAAPRYLTESLFKSEAPAEGKYDKKVTSEAKRSSGSYYLAVTLRHDVFFDKNAGRVMDALFKVMHKDLQVNVPMRTVNTPEGMMLVFTMTDERAAREASSAFVGMSGPEFRVTSGPLPEGFK